MLVVLASRHDQAARALVGRWAAHGAALLSPDDLSVAGWRWEPGRAAASTAVVDGQVVPVEAIDGVVTRLPVVVERELAWILAADRAYVAAEMTAFLLAWLSRLDCSVVNRPTPACLAGPSWPPERWVHVGAQLAIPVRRCLTPNERHDGEADSALSTVTVVGDRCLGQADPTLARHARHLARAAGAELLAVRFSGPEADACLIGAHLWPDVSLGEVADALLAHLLAARTEVWRRRDRALGLAG